MGIKFYCPNGHRLNVKSYLAGKRGICPHCGARLRIPPESQQEAAVARSRRGAAAHVENNGSGDHPAHAAPSASPAGGMPFDIPFAPAGPMDETARARPDAAQPSLGSSVPSAGNHHGIAPVPTAHAAAVPAPAAAPAASVASVAPVGPHPGGDSGGIITASTVAPMPQAAPMSDAISEAPQAVWYVRPTSGGQYGPAGGEIMRKWIGEGRVSGDSLVWREGWPDWRAASSVFPALGSAAPAAASLAPQAASPVPAATPTAHSMGSLPATSTRYQQRRRGNPGLAIFVVLALGLLCAVLGVVFVLVATGVLSPG